MKTDIKQEADITVVEVSETIDALTAPELTRALSREMAEGRCNLVVDLTRVEFMSSAGIRAIMAALKATRTYNRGDVRVSAPSKPVMETLELAGMKPVIKVFADDIQAVGSW